MTKYVCYVIIISNCRPLAVSFFFFVKKDFKPKNPCHGNERFNMNLENFRMQGRWGTHRNVECFSLLFFVGKFLFSFFLVAFLDFTFIDCIMDKADKYHTNVIKISTLHANLGMNSKQTNKLII